MYFDLSISIDRSPEDVFGFLRDKDKYPQEPGSPVLVLDLTTPGPAGVGTRYREVVRMLPLVRGEIHSVITDFEPGRRLAEDFEGAGMVGHLEYRFEPEGEGTRLTQRESVQTTGFARLLGPMMQPALGRQLRKRLEAIKAVLDAAGRNPLEHPQPRQGDGGEERRRPPDPTREQAEAPSSWDLLPLSRSGLRCQGGRCGRVVP